MPLVFYQLNHYKHHVCCAVNATKVEDGAVVADVINSFYLSHWENYRQGAGLRLQSHQADARHSHSAVSAGESSDTGLLTTRERPVDLPLVVKDWVMIPFAHENGGVGINQEDVLNWWADGGFAAGTPLCMPLCCCRISFFSLPANNCSSPHFRLLEAGGSKDLLSYWDALHPVDTPNGFMDYAKRLRIAIDEKKAFTLPLAEKRKGNPFTYKPFIEGEDIVAKGMRPPVDASLVTDNPGKTEDIRNYMNAQRVR